MALDATQRRPSSVASCQDAQGGLPEGFTYVPTVRAVEPMEATPHNRVAL